MSALPIPLLPAINPPAVLREHPAWLLWRYEMLPDDKKPRKVPYYTRGGKRMGVQGSDSDRSGLVDFDTALAVLGRKFKGADFRPDDLARPGFNGLGFAMLPDWKLAGLDFDDCVADGEIHPGVLALVGDTYAELSPSGRGVRAFMAGELVDKKSHAVGGLQFGFETFHAKGFLTFTGNVLPGWDLLGLDDTVQPLTEAVVAFCGERFGAVRLKPVRAEVEDDGDGQPPQGLTDDEIRGILSHLDPNADKYELWLRTGQEIHHETGGAQRGLELWDAWSYGQTGENYAGREVIEDKWSSFGRGGARQATIGSTMARARAAGWQQPIPDDFEALPALSTAEAALALPVFKRDKAGILATVDNLKMALDRPDVCGAAIRFDTFRDEIMLSEDGETGWRPFEDADYTRMRLALERGGFKPVGREIMRDVVLLVATEHKFDTAQVWLGGLKWDGKPRVEGFLRDYFGAEDTPYTRGVSIYMWTALAGRVVDPGCKADMVPILVGAQGIRKSSSVAAMVPAPDFFAEIDFGEKDADLSRKMRGCLVGEIGELRGLNSKDLESIKAFITRTHEKWVPKFREFTTTFPRRLLFIGTTNQEEFLADETGNRRWLPVRVPFADRDAVARDALQLWAEARDKHAELGVCFREAEELAAEAHAAHSIHDAWEDLVRGWLDELDVDDKPIVREFLRATDVLRDAIRLEPRNIGRREEMRIAKVFKDLGYTRKKQRIGNATAWVWVE